MTVHLESQTDPSAGSPARTHPAVHGFRRPLPRTDAPAVRVAAGVGTGPTAAAARDAAYRRAGIGNQTVVPVRPVVPKGATVIDGDGPVFLPSAGWGDRLYAVVAEAAAAAPGAEAWAGIGWAQDPSSGRGLIVDGHGSSEQEVRAEIEASLAAMIRGRGELFGPAQTRVGGVRSDGGTPVCALAVAIIAAEPWS